MSLFPAYDGVPENTKNVPDESWMQNASFQIPLPNQMQIQESTFTQSSEDEKQAESAPLEPRKESKKKSRKLSKSSENDSFFIDKKCTKEFLTVKTISRPSVSKYNVHYYIMTKRQKKKRFKRYFQQLVIKELCAHEKELNKPNSNNLTESKSIIGSADYNSTKHEEELTQITGSYNKTVFNEPNNVDVWLKFIDFQDTLFEFEKNFKKGSIAKGLRANAERKLNILEKALNHNPNSEALQRKRLHVMVSVYPADELQTQLRELLRKFQGNIILWQGYIEATQCSMSHCNTSSVRTLYTNCLSTLHKIRRNSLSDNKMLEESILKMLYQCGLFFKQSGLFEQLWTLLKMYLDMNLGQLVENRFEIPIKINEVQLLELEDMVFKSQLPSHELWLRIEKLRESCHWLPVVEQCEDPHRIVFREDVVELIQPITMPENTFRLTATVLTLLKIPLLPCRHKTMQELGLDHVPWALDSIEIVLPIYFSVYPINLKFEDIFIDYQLAVGPQYLKVLPGQEEYLSFILSVMKKCIDCLEGDDKSSVIVWWLRFQRLLIILDNNGRFKMPPKLKKSIKASVKDLLKKPENRMNKLFYVEYALIERELNSGSKCIEVLEIALSFIKNLNIDISNVNEELGSTCYLIKTLVENLIHLKKTDKAIKYLINLAVGNPIQSECDTTNEETLNHATLKFKHVTLQLLAQIESGSLPPVKHFLPIFLCDWIICNGWFIFLTKGPLECGTFLENALEKFNEKTPEKILQEEIIFEFYVAVMFNFCTSNPGYGLFKALDDVVYRAVQYFPNNLFILSVLAKEQFMLNSLGPKWWTTKNLLLKTGHALPTLLLILITHQIITNLQEQLMDTITGCKMDMTNTNFKNTMLSLFVAATKPNMCTRRCGLVWRLYLQFVHKYSDPKLCRKVYYSAVEECPWLKALYIDAAIYIPAELGQIQDLIIEKQLRIHITPEELEILRD